MREQRNRDVETFRVEPPSQLDDLALGPSPIEGCHSQTHADTLAAA
jgi:hypothetical protein